MQRLTERDRNKKRKRSMRGRGGYGAALASHFDNTNARRKMLKEQRREQRNQDEEPTE